MAKNVVGLFNTINDAQSAVSELQQAGFDRSTVSLIQRSSSQLTSIFGQLGIPDEDAGIYQDGVQSGGALVVVQQVNDRDANRAAEILDRHNLIDISQRGRMTQHSTQRTSASAQTSGQASTGTQRRGYYEGGEMVIPIVEEELSVGKREVESGGVRVETRVEERPVNEQVTLRNEEVHVERRAVNQPVDPSEIDNLVREGLFDQSFEVREHDEEAVVSKEARLVEEVVINKDVEQRTETIQDTVRRTDVDVEQVPGQKRTSGTTTVSGMTGSTAGNSQGEGVIERGLSRAGNAVEGATGLDMDQDGDVGRRDPKNNY